MTGSNPASAARKALRLVLAVGFLAMLGANLPGHMSLDSISQLKEGHDHVRETWAPAMYAWILGFFDRFIPGSSLYVVASGLLFFASLAALADLRPRTSWLAVPVAILVMATPQVMIYQAIVWKDVMFANCSVAGLVCIAQAAHVWTDRRRRWLWLAGALMLLAAGCQVRQNGAVVAVPASMALGWIASSGRWRRGLAWGLGAFVAVMAMAQVQMALVTPAKGAPEVANPTSIGVQIIQNYDLLAAVSLDPGYHLGVMAAANPAATKVIAERAKLNYSGRRVDFYDRDEVLGRALWSFPPGVAGRQWVDLVTRHTGLYLRVRWEDFRWLFASPVIDWCLPVYVGVDAWAVKAGMQPRFVQSDVELNNYATWFFDTPVLSHVAYSAVSLVLAGLFLWRRQPADIAMGALQLAGLGFTASFFVITLACDYRYLYFADLAALAGLLYAAIDPPRPWRRRLP